MTLPEQMLPSFFFMTDAGDPCAIARTLPKGSGIILRHYNVPRRRLARALKEIATHRALRLLIADDNRLALALGADGVHYPEYRLQRWGTHGWLNAHRHKPDWLITASAHGAAALARAARAGADAALIAPVFATPTHPDAQTLGVVRFAALAHQARLPVYALGGMNARTDRRIAHIPHAGLAGTRRVAQMRLVARGADGVSQERTTLKRNSPL